MARSAKGSTLLETRHTAAAPKTLEEVMSLINVADARFEATVEQYRYLATKVINSGDLERFVRIVAEENLEKTRSELGTRMRNRSCRTHRSWQRQFFGGNHNPHQDLGG